MTLSMIPDLTRAVGVPRLVGVSHPMGQPLGRPGDAARQRAVLSAMLELLASASGPPFEWPETRAQVFQASRDVPPSPITELMLKCGSRRMRMDPPWPQVRIGRRSPEFPEVALAVTISPCETDA